jgi:FAD:protein FMN transferase
MTLAPQRHTRAAIAMDTFVSASVVTSEPWRTVAPVLERALGWFGAVERACSRFDEHSELARLCASVGRPVEVSTMLLQLTRFALHLARLSDGAFDPTVGLAQSRRGFDEHYRTGATRRPRIEAAPSTSYRDVRVDAEAGTITLLRPLLLDLGAVAKGLAIDLAARELDRFGDFCVDAGGDVYVRGTNERGTPWRVGVRHPRDPEEIVMVLDLSDRAVCTSGDYERPASAPGEHHLLDPRRGRSPTELASVTVVAPTALMADGLATAAFVLGPDAGRRLLERHGVGGVLISPGLEVRTTAWFVEALT